MGLRSFVASNFHHGLEARHAALVAGDELTVDDSILDWQVFDRRLQGAWKRLVLLARLLVTI